MTSAIRHVTIDANDPYSLAQFWSGVLGYTLYPESRLGDDEILLESPAPLPGLLFVRVPEPKTGKSRMHFDITPETTRDEELERVLALGATVVEDHRRADGRGWVWCADPEGNAFCVERSETEKAAWDAANGDGAA